MADDGVVETMPLAVLIRIKSPSTKDVLNAVPVPETEIELLLNAADVPVPCDFSE